MNSPMLPVAILAGGLAMRLRPLTTELPKALVEVDGEPFVARQLQLLCRNGITRVVLCVGYLGEQIVAALGDGGRFGLHLSYSFDGPALLGTAGALRQALPQLGQPFFVLYGDSYLDCDYRAVQTAFEKSGKPALMTVFRNEGQWDTSNVEYADGRILAYSKQRRTPQMRHIDYGLGILHPSVLAAVPGGAPYDLATLYMDLLAQDQLAAYEVSQRFYEIGSPTGLEELRHHLSKQTKDRRTHELY